MSPAVMIRVASALVDTGTFNETEEEFLNDLNEKLTREKSNMTISEKQLRWLEKLYDRATM